MPKLATKVVLSDQSQEELRKISKRATAEQRIVLRAKIILAASLGHSNAKISRELKVNVDTVRLWRDRWVALSFLELKELSVEDRLTDAERPGKPSAITEEQRCQIAALACEPPNESGRPISHWTGREIADEMVKRGIVSQISPRYASLLLKKKG
jgi:transposase